MQTWNRGELNVPLRGKVEEGASPTFDKVGRASGQDGKTYSTNKYSNLQEQGTAN